MKNDKPVTTKNYILADGGFTKPKQEKIFTVNEISNLVDYTPNAVCQIAKKLNVGLKHKPLVKGGSCYDFTYSDYLAIKKYVDERKAIKEKFQQLNLAKIKSKEETLQELKKLHPLVTDEKFFKLEFFPDVMPECFKEMEE